MSSFPLFVVCHPHNLGGRQASHVRGLKNWSKVEEGRERGLFKLGVKGVIDAWNLVVCGVGLQLVDRNNRIALQLWYFFFI